MNIHEFIDRVLAASVQSGMTAAEVFYQSGNSFRAGSMDGELKDYQVSEKSGLGFRASWNGRIGYASTQAYDEEAIEQLITAAKESAQLNEAKEQDEIFAGDPAYPELASPETDIAAISAEQKLSALKAMDDAVRNTDERVKRSEHCMVMTTESSVILKNTSGLDLEHKDSLWMAFAGALASENEKMVTGGELDYGHKFSDFKPELLAKQAIQNTVDQLGAASVEPGEYRIILHRDALCDLLAAFSGVFSAENAWQKLSRLGDKEGEKIASQEVTLMDDPLLPGGPASCPFDGEGSACRTKAVIENGVLKTLLHNRKTALRVGKETTGNASRGSFSSSIGVSPSNFYFVPGNSTLDELQSAMGEGIVITEVSGLHAGANEGSGDFSLLSKGYRIREGKRAEAIEQITIAGNFYDVLKNIRAFANDLRFPGSRIGSPSADIGTLVVSGQA